MSAAVDLSQVPMFSKLSQSALAEVSAALRPKQLAGGQVLFNQGDPGQELILVEQGKIAIFIPTQESASAGQAIRIFQPGEILGEMALIDQKPRSTSARAEEACRIFTLTGEDFRRILSQNPEMSVSVMAGLNDRIRYTTEFLGEVRNWVRRMSEGNYQTGTVMDSSKYKDQTLANLAAEFAQMAARVQEREETLRREVAQLRIEIDESRRKADVARITGSDYFQNLKEKAKSLRQRDEE
jgi:CRP-like cAMP-binding protein